MTKEEFLKDVGNWDNHRILLWQALEATKHMTSIPVLELGCGDGSTPFLRKYCNDNNAQLYSYDSDPVWAAKFNSTHARIWDIIPWRISYRVALVDEAPGEHRKISIQNLERFCQIIVVHDSEPIGWNASDYQVRPLFERFKYMKDLPSEKPGGAWATALSNTIDVTKFEL